MNEILKKANAISFSMILEGGVLNRNDSVGNITVLKKVNSYDGQKVTFSDKSYKRALYSSAERRINDWGSSGLSKAGGVIQKLSTIIESDEYDLAGTMVAKVVSRDAVFRVGQGISINNYMGDTEFLTNMAMAKRYGDDTNPYTREVFHGLYRISGNIDLDRLGKEDCLIETKLPKDFQGSSDRVRAGELLYDLVSSKEVRKFPNKDTFMEHVNSKVETLFITSEGKEKVRIQINLTRCEKIKRLKKILFTIPEVYRNIEARVEPLSPVFMALYYGTLCPFVHNYLRHEKEGGVIRSLSPLDIDIPAIETKLQGRSITEYSIEYDPVDAVNKLLTKIVNNLWKQ